MRSMLSERARLALVEIQENAALAREFTAAMTWETFATDRRTFYAVQRCLEIISEASRRLPDEVKNRHPAIEWIEMAAAGNIYRHEYNNVVPRRVWNTVHDHLTPLLIAVEEEIVAAGTT